MLPEQQPTAPAIHSTKIFLLPFPHIFIVKTIHGKEDKLSKEIQINPVCQKVCRDSDVELWWYNREKRLNRPGFNGIMKLEVQKHHFFHSKKRRKQREEGSS